MKRYPAPLDLPVARYPAGSPTRRTWGWLVSRPPLFKKFSRTATTPEALRDAILTAMARRAGPLLMAPSAALVARAALAEAVDWGAIHDSMRPPADR